MQFGFEYDTVVKKSPFLECRPDWFDTMKIFSFPNAVFRYQIDPR